MNSGAGAHHSRHGNNGERKSEAKLKCSIKDNALPYRGEPTRAAYKKPVMGEGKYIHVIPSVYNPRPAPVPSRKPAPKKKAVKASKARRRREVRQPPRYWTDERVKTLIELYDQGLIYADIAFQMETSRSAVNSEINRLISKKVIQPRKQGDRWEQEEVDRLVELKKSGKTIAEISDILGKSKKSCYSEWRLWNDKQASLRGVFRGMDDGRGKP